MTRIFAKDETVAGERFSIKYKSYLEVYDSLMQVFESIVDRTEGKIRDTDRPLWSIMLLLSQNLTLLSAGMNTLVSGYLPASEMIIRGCAERTILAIYFKEFPQAEIDYLSLKVDEFRKKHPISKMMLKVEKQGGIFKKKDGGKVFLNLILYKSLYIEACKFLHPLVGQGLQVKELKLAKGNYYPIGTYDKFTDVDPLASVLSVLSKSEPTEVTMVQIALEATSSSWQGRGASYADMGTKNEDGTYSPRSDKPIITEKISYPGFKASIRLISNTNKTLTELASSFGVFDRADGNHFSTIHGSLFSKPVGLKTVLERLVTGNNILNILELATLWHLPSEKIKTTGIAWGTKVLSEPPENLPNAITATEDDKAHIAFFGKTLFKNRDTIFGIKDIDRRRHMWAIGKTGTGKSTLIANMAIDDLKKDRGIAIIDPHGDLSDIVLDYIPKRRINDVIYFNPADKDYPVIINPLEVTNKEEAELVVSGIVSIFNKIFGFSWGPRLEYILRNSLSTLAQIPDSTLKDVPLLLTNKSFRQKIEGELKDPVMVHFWRDEFDKMPDRLQQDAISPILNKVGQFVSSPLIRSVIGHPKSSISLDDAMNHGKILLANLSQGRLGEDNAALLGAMLITKFQLAAMHRVEMPEEKRRDFYLYVDEFQNFATGSFIKIMSEARKYRLDIMLANQYMAQIPEEVTKAILGNAGTIMTFAVGANDAEILNKEFAEVFSVQDLINLGEFQIATKMTIDGQVTRPFVATTLPLPISSNQNREKVIQVSRERWTRRLSQPPVTNH